MQQRAEVLCTRSDVEGVRDAWDALAEQRGAPCSAPDWALAWWDHAAPARARLRVVVVRDDDGVVTGIAPLYLLRGGGVVRCGFVGDAVTSPVVPLARDGGEAELAHAVATALASSRPRPDVIAFGNVPLDSPWPALLQAAWPGLRPMALREERLATPYIDLGGTYEQWVAGQSRNFRQQLRRHRRRIEARGGRFRRVTDPAELDDRLHDFARLHHARFEDRGGSAVLDHDVMAMLLDAGTRTLTGDRFQLWVIEAEDKVISAHVLLAAGGRVTYWLGGFDDDWGADQPALQTLAAALEHAFEAGRSTFDLGPGLQDYKLRFTKQTAQGVEALLVVPGARTPLTLARVLGPRLGRETMRWIRANVPDETRSALRQRAERMLGRRSGSAPGRDHDSLI